MSQLGRITFIHAADLHLDSPFQNTSGFSSLWIDRLKESTWGALGKLISLAIAEKVDFVILVGDIFDQESYSVKTQLRFMKELKKLADKQIHTYIVHGNHDFVKNNVLALSSIERIDSNIGAYVHIFSAENVQAYSVYKNGEQVAKLYGRSYWQRHVYENLAAEYIKYIEAERLEELQRNSQYNSHRRVKNIAVLHGLVGGNEHHSAYAPASLDELINSQFGYWALGHVHQRKIINTSKPVIAYPGNTQGRHMGEMGECGCYLVNWNDEDIQMEFHSLEAVRWEELYIDLTSLDDEGNSRSISHLLVELEQQLQAFHSTIARPTIVRLVLTGQTQLYYELREQSILDYIKEELSGTDAYVYEIINNTLPIIDIQKLRQQHTLLGQFLSIIHRARFDEDLKAELVEQLKPLLNGQRFRNVTSSKKELLGQGGWKALIQADDTQKILDEVERLGIDIFLTGAEDNECL